MLVNRKVAVPDLVQSPVLQVAEHGVPGAEARDDSAPGRDEERLPRVGADVPPIDARPDRRLRRHAARGEDGPRTGEAPPLGHSLPHLSGNPGVSVANATET